MKVRHFVRVVAFVGALTAVGAQQSAPKSGLDPAAFDKSVRPQDDLFRYVNGTWLAKTELPADKAVYGTFVLLADKAEADLYALIEELAGAKDKRAGSRAQQVGDLYASFINEARVNSLGNAPLKPRLAEVDAVKSTAELATLLGKLSMMGLPGPVGGFVEADAGDPTKVALYLNQGGTALPDRDYYLVDDAKFVDIRAKYQQYLEKVFTLAERPNAAADAKAVLALETELARIQWTQVESRDAVKTYNKIGRRQDRRRHARIRLGGVGKAAAHRHAPGVGHRSAVVLQGLRGDGSEDAARDLEGVDRRAGDHDAGAAPQPAVRRCARSRCSARR